MSWSEHGMLVVCFIAALDYIVTEFLKGWRTA